MAREKLSTVPCRHFSSRKLMTRLNTSAAHKVDRSIPIAVPIKSSLNLRSCERPHASARNGEMIIGTDGTSISSQRAAETGRGCGGCGSGSGMAGEDFDVRSAIPAAPAWRFAFPARVSNPVCPRIAQHFSAGSSGWKGKESRRDGRTILSSLRDLFCFVARTQH